MSGDEINLPDGSGGRRFRSKADVARIAELEATLAWYAEQARLARLIHSEGDAGRAALAADGGARALNVIGK